MRLKYLAWRVARAFGGPTKLEAEAHVPFNILYWYTVPIDVRLKNERRRLVIHESPTKESTDGRNGTAG